MSLGDFVRFQRAVKGGPTPWQIEADTGIPPGIYRQIEQRYRAIGEEDLLEKIAAYYGVAVEELRWRQHWPRKGLTATLVDAQENDRPLTLVLRNGEALSGAVQWWDLGALAIRQDDGGLLVVQRHFIDRWEFAE